MERTEEIVRLVWDVEKKVNTVVAIGVGTRCDADGEEQRGGADTGAAGIQAGCAPRRIIGLGRASPAQIAPTDARRR